MEKSGALLMVFLGLLVTVSQTVVASDPDLTTDFDVTNPTAADFTFTLDLAEPGPGVFNLTLAAFNTGLPGLNGLGLSAALFAFGPYSQADPHLHSRGTEIFYLLQGTVEVGFVYTHPTGARSLVATNTLLKTTLQAGQLFVFPKGLLHFVRNNQNSVASGYSVLSSEDAGVLFVAQALFTVSGTGLPDNVLETAFGTDAYTIDSIKKSLGDSVSPAPAPSGH